MVGAGVGWGHPSIHHEWYSRGQLRDQDLAFAGIDIWTDKTFLFYTYHNEKKNKVLSKNSRSIDRLSHQDAFRSRGNNSKNQSTYRIMFQQRVGRNSQRFTSHTRTRLHFCPPRKERQPQRNNNNNNNNMICNRSGFTSLGRCTGQNLHSRIDVQKKKKKKKTLMSENKTLP